MSGALLVDFDGTLVESLSGLRSVLDAFLRARSVTPSAGEFESLNGPPLREVVAQLASRYELTEPLADLLAEYERRVGEVYAGAPQKPGARDLLTTARDVGMRVGIVTSNHRVNVARWLQSQRLDRLVDHITDARASPRGKPHPGPYLRAMEHLRVNVQSSVAVEDSPSGATAAREAGLRTFVLGAPHHAWPAGCEVVSSLGEVTGALRGV